MPAQPAPANVPARPSPPVGSTLGTQWGEGRASQVQTVAAIRVTPDSQQAVATLSYSDEASIRLALGGRADQQLNLLLHDGRVEWSVRDAQNRPLPIFSAPGRKAEYHVAGRDGERYELVYVNRSQQHYEIVATVDGLDVLSGQPGSLRNRGYLLEPGETLRIDGFRKSDDEVATFRFASKSNAYASNTPAGNPRNVGVIGTALFEVRLAGASARDLGRTSVPGGQNAFPADSDGRGSGGAGRFAPPPQYR
ncbi:hypothetical protein SDC9_86634 [bioreactor metagenome]|uniref:Uncharacterized protein n=1 Tax=bioreactor metagenome TaxID=1076179 RepID=A0A644ZGN1_9ZZZZ